MGATWIPVLGLVGFVVAWCIDRMEVRRAVRRANPPMLVLVPYYVRGWGWCSRTPKDDPPIPRYRYTRGGYSSSPRFVTELPPPVPRHPRVWEGETTEPIREWVDYGVAESDVTTGHHDSI